MKIWHNFGFSSIFCHWIHNILQSARVSVLMNDSMVGYFSCSRGVRQGDLLYPILFGLAEDFMSWSLLKIVRNNVLSRMSANK